MLAWSDLRARPFNDWVISEGEVGRTVIGPAGAYVNNSMDWGSAQSLMTTVKSPTGGTWEPPAGVEGSGNGIRPVASEGLPPKRDIAGRGECSFAARSDISRTRRPASEVLRPSALTTCGTSRLAMCSASWRTTSPTILLAIACSVFPRFDVHRVAASAAEVAARPLSPATDPTISRASAFGKRDCEAASGFVDCRISRRAHKCADYLGWGLRHGEPPGERFVRSDGGGHER